MVLFVCSTQSSIFTKDANTLSIHLWFVHDPMKWSTTLIHGSLGETFLDFQLPHVVNLTEVEVNRFAVESDFSVTLESVDELSFGGVVGDDELRRTVVVDDSNPTEWCRWRCNYYCCLFACYLRRWSIRRVVACSHLNEQWCVLLHDSAGCCKGISSLLWRIVRIHHENDQHSSAPIWCKIYFGVSGCGNVEQWAQECQLFPASLCFPRRRSVIKNINIMNKWRTSTREASERNELNDFLNEMINCGKNLRRELLTFRKNAIVSDGISLKSNLCCRRDESKWAN